MYYHFTHGSVIQILGEDHKSASKSVIMLWVEQPQLLQLLLLHSFVFYVWNDQIIPLPSGISNNIDWKLLSNTNESLKCINQNINIYIHVIYIFLDMLEFVSIFWIYSIFIYIYINIHIFVFVTYSLKCFVFSFSVYIKERNRERQIPHTGHNSISWSV